MLSLALSIFYSTRIDLFQDGRAQFVGLFLLEGWQHFGAALLVGCDLGRRKVAGTGFGVQGIDLSSCFDRSDCLLVRPDAKPDPDFDAAVCAIGMRSPLPTALHTGFQFGFFNAALAILGRIATQLNLSGRCRVILSPT
ncbi:hypothetical protein HNI00_02915 [Thermoleptolyngbya oregonensis NK1-22]|uniref:Uncharacterized protein n=1 Tax=Thermoleptolyngbya oregonensis NK1-22 TaxID=2547457 RepID=A0AA96YL82_9CYAN|nr:hypothetical protein [Thermoleptolyngbya oregonensis]WOB42232.1 hypothetical protein HNI00_02915 [Thermoleptolyngbya oregonensis NK1-22]